MTDCLHARPCARAVGVALSVLFLTASLSGCTTVSNAITGNDEVDVPTWEVGDWWLYTFSTPEYTDDTARLVVASVSEEGGTAKYAGHI
ncbi:MAG: hypothetical protein CM1200mP21_00800 [Candidatus Poseidoniales archaeon]|nr:MAG: hypothetical protein CM1200mP21_00800 [Candidatus Poseidoniales archaeon]